jgi:hypothetical protein
MIDQTVVKSIDPWDDFDNVWCGELTPDSQPIKDFTYDPSNDITVFKTEQVVKYIKCYWCNPAESTNNCAAPA